MKNILCSIMICSTVGVNEFFAQPTLKIPFIQKNVCPFEFGCDFSLWISKSKIMVFRFAGDTSKISFTLNPNDTFTVHAANMHIEKPGIVLVTKPIESFQVGDTVFVLSYTGEGMYDVWYRGEIYNRERFWDYEDLPQFEGLLVCRPRMSWWLMVELKSKKKGWIRLINRSDSGVRFDENIDMGKTNEK